MNYITDGNDPTRHDVIKPQQQTGNEEQHSAEHNGPEINLLTSVEKPDLSRLHFVLISCVLPDAFQPTSVIPRPHHRRQPIKKLKKKKPSKKNPNPGGRSASLAHHQRSVLEIDRATANKERNL